MTTKFLYQVLDLETIGFLLCCVVLLLYCFENKITDSCNYIVKSILRSTYVIIIMIIDVIFIIHLIVEVVILKFNIDLGDFLYFSGFLMVYLFPVTLINYLFFSTVKEEIQFYKTERSLLSIIIKTLGALTLFLTSLKGIFDEFNFLNTVITFLSTMTLLYAFVEVCIEYKLYRNNQKNSKRK
ncbi:MULTISPECIES: hypothetical protein [Staphylococcus]|uniref:hypothetical protein n=1 Tax=Staphylococcus TaxID=1279 RepID=UPI0011A6D515|nr:hypothetical protein [Staphylococcus warneri]